MLAFSTGTESNSRPSYATASGVRMARMRAARAGRAHDVERPFHADLTGFPVR